ncbi:hypothetical protein JW921_07980, partial [Candidatus Fermentibacterales bacterium]|nr:hypothetical protein [Candidatus Fermentibacterales bacterium]
CEMAELPQVELVGDTTLGAANGPPVAWLLPESWYATCPERTVLRPDTAVIESHGIPPGVVVDASEEDFQNGVDPVLEHAFKCLGAQPPGP